MEEEDDDDIVLLILFITLPIVGITGIIIGVWAYVTKCWKQPCRPNKNAVEDEKTLHADWGSYV